MKKFLVILTGGALLITSCALFAETTASLGGQVGDLQQKLKRVKQINTLTKKTQSQEQQINILTKQYKDTSNELAFTKEQVKSANIQISSLQANNASLKALKATLEEQSLATQNKLTASYTTKINAIQKNNKEKLDTLLKEYTAEKNETLNSTIKEKDKFVKEMNYKLNDSTKLTVELQKEIQDYKDKLSTNDTTFTALKSTVKTLSNQKKQLEKDFSESQEKTITDYKAQIDQINKAAELRIDSIKQQYSELSSRNNQQLSHAKENFNTKLQAKKRVLREQLDGLISSVNKKQAELYRTAQDIADSSNTIGSATSSLEKAYQNIGNPYPKKSGLSSMLGLEKENPSWDTISSSNTNLRANITTLRAISDSLSKDNVNNKQLLKENQKSGSRFLGIF